MSRWSYLPYAILEIVFKYLEQETDTLIYPIKSENAPSSNMFQYQLICKDWASLAQQKIYKQVVIRSIQQLDFFIHTLQNSDVGPLVEHIYLKPETSEPEIIESLLVYIRHTVHFCTFLKSLYIESGDFQGFWKLIRDERLKRDFTRLQAIPSVKNLPDENILDYHSHVFSPQQMLRELVIHNRNVSLDETKQWHFPHMDTIVFKLDSCADVTMINKYMKWLPSFSAIQVHFEYLTIYQYQGGDELPVHVAPQVKQLCIKSLYLDTRIYTYLMKAFPNLQSLDVVVIISGEKRKLISIKETIQFLDYLLRLSKLHINCIPIEGQDDVMLSFYDKSERIKKLKLTYTSTHSYHDTAYLTIQTCTKVKERINVKICHIADIPPLLPRIGLIERSGKNLQYLEIDMGLKISDMRLMVQTLNSGVTLSSVLQQCPRLLGICIQNTILNSFGSDILFQNRVRISDNMRINNSLIHTSFLSRLSPCVPYIYRFKLRECEFIDEAPGSTIREIDMSSTKFHTIEYYDQILAPTVYLKLNKTINNTVSWYVLRKRYVKTCTENEYINSLPDQEAFSLSIRCIDTFTIKIKLLRVEVTIET